jgi:hypothetical protein
MAYYKRNANSRSHLFNLAAAWKSLQYCNENETAVRLHLMPRSDQFQLLKNRAEGPPTHKAQSKGV